MWQSSPCADKEELLSALSKTVFSQYGSNLTKDDDIFPLVVKIVAWASLPSTHTEEESANESDNDPRSRSLSRNSTPQGVGLPLARTM
jgi:hypothetical protein